MNYLCPVCGYDKMESPPANHTICVSCGTQFDYHDCTLTHAQLRQRWIDRGAKWHSRRVLPPPPWSALQQLQNIGYSPAEEDRKRIAAADKNEALEVR